MTLHGSSLYIPTNGIQLHVRHAGAESDPLLILLHGFPDFWYGWNRQIPSLSQAGYHVIVPDQRGYNLSEKPSRVSEYTISELAKDVIGIIDFFGREKTILAGHDWGAAVAWYIGMVYPQRLERLIVVNVPHHAAMNRALQKPVLRQLLKSWYMFYFQIPGLPEFGLSTRKFNPLEKALVSTARPGSFSAEDLQEYRKAWAQPGAITGAINWYRAIMRQGLASGKTRFTNHFKKRVSVPTLLLWGDKDAFLEPFLADWSMEWVDHGKLVRFPEASHWILCEEPDQVSQEIIHFLKDD